jgi:hypothetical protein
VQAVVGFFKGNLALAVDVVFGTRSQQSAPRIFRDFTHAVVYVIVFIRRAHGSGKFFREVGWRGALLLDSRDRDEAE